ncbi:MAG: aldo/keto reductase [Pirellulales bacterium]
MEYRDLGSTGIEVSAVSFGAGPVPALMTAGSRDKQRSTVERALAAGVNWFDTAATYGDGASESSLGAALRELGGAGRVHVATKVRLMPDQLGDIRAAVRQSVDASLQRLGLQRVTLLQVHNSITARRGELHTSITPRDVLGPGGMLDAFQSLRDDGLVEHFGLTALGQQAALQEVLESRAFASVQLAYNLLDATAGSAAGSAARLLGPDTAVRQRRTSSGTSLEADGDSLLSFCSRARIGVLAIRVFAGGALAGKPPSRHTLTTRFFPLALYERDAQRARQLAETLPPGLRIKEAAVRFVLSQPGVSSALVGFSSGEEVDEAVRFAAAGPLPPAALETIGQALSHPINDGSGRST